MNRYQELSPNSMTEEGLKSLLAFQSILMNLATSFINIPLQEIDDTIEQMLASVGAFTQVDRACFYRYDFEAGEARLSHEWKRQSIGPLPAQRRRMLLEGWLEDWSRQHQQGQVIYAESSQKDEGQTKLAAHLAEMGVKNAVSLPVMNQTDCLGFICFEAMTKRLDWRQKELDLLKVVAGLVSNALTRQAHERALTESKRRAEEKSREKSHFLADMSHEIRTPMNGIIGFLDLLSQTELDEDQAFFVREVQDASESLLSLLNDILDFSKIEAGKLELDKHTMDLHRVVESVASIFALKAQEKGVEIHTVIDPAVPQRVNGDSGKLRQILTNLVSNAVKFTERGAISISVHR